MYIKHIVKVWWSDPPWARRASRGGRDQMDCIAWYDVSAVRKG